MIFEKSDEKVTQPVVCTKQNLQYDTLKCTRKLTRPAICTTQRRWKACGTLKYGLHEKWTKTRDQSNMEVDKIMISRDQSNVEVDMIMIMSTLDIGIDNILRLLNIFSTNQKPEF